MSKWANEKSWKKSDTVVIVGYAPSRDELGYNWPDADIWGMNDLWRHQAVPHWDAWFDMHHDHVTASNPRTGKDHLDWLKGVTQFPIFLLKEKEEYPCSVAYPLEKVHNKFRAGKKEYFTSTPAYMIALAMYLGYKKIVLYGINLMGDEEYAYQRPCFEYWCGRAEGIGIEVEVAPGATVLEANFLYGYETHNDNNDFSNLLTKKILDSEQRKNEAIAFVHRIEGSLDVLKWAKTMHKSYINNVPMPERHKPVPFIPVFDKAKDVLKGPHEDAPKERQVNVTEVKNEDN